MEMCQDFQAVQTATPSMPSRAAKYMKFALLCSAC